MPLELFVYWKVERARGAEAQTAATRMLQTLRFTQPALRSCLLRRAEESGDKITYMETYSALPAGVTPELQLAVEAAAANALVAFAGLTRHVEIFERLDPAA